MAINCFLKRNMLRMVMPHFFLPIIAFFIGMITVQAGVSGAFLLLPVQISLLDITSPVASATNLAYNIIAIPVAVLRFKQEKRFILPLILAIIAGAAPGVFLGTLLRTTLLLNPKPFKLFVGIVLCLLGLKLIFAKKEKEMAITSVEIIKNSLLRLKFRFGHQTFSFSPLIIFAVTFFTSIISGAYGIGGGALLSPLLISVFGLPPHATASATLSGTFITSIIGVFSYAHFGYTPNWPIAFLFGIGGMSGMYVAARIQKYIPPFLIKIALACLIFIPALRYIIGYFH